MINFDNLDLFSTSKRIYTEDGEIVVELGNKESVRYLIKVSKEYKTLDLMWGTKELGVDLRGFPIDTIESCVFLKDSKKLIIQTNTPPYIFAAKCNNDDISNLYKLIEQIECIYDERYDVIETDQVYKIEKINNQ